MSVTEPNQLHAVCPLRASRGAALTGSAHVPGDKSISHRSLMLGALAVGRTRVTGLLEGEDVLRTADAMRAMGAEIARTGEGAWEVHGVGLGGLGEPETVLDMGNSGTSTRLLMGVVGGHDMTAFFTGDASLRKRPMGRVVTPLEKMGVTFMTRAMGRLPLGVRGAHTVLPLTYELPVASAQVKSAILLAGLMAPGATTVIERKPTRDHTETMLRHFGGTVETVETDDNALAVTVTGQPELTACDIVVPADPSAAAFPVVAALITPGSDLFLPGVGINPRRAGILETLVEMGGDITFENERIEGGEKLADLRVRYSELKGVYVPPERAPSMIDEYPVLAVAASCAEGKTEMPGIGELRVKESDRLEMTARGLQACGVRVETGKDEMTVYGNGKPPKGGASIATELDHRIAMSFLVLGGVTEEAVAIDDAAPIATSFPGFAEMMNGLGCNIGPA